MAPESRTHIPEVDAVKGLAILAVVCIHAKFLEGSLVHAQFINRATSVFLVLFGVTSELWWQREAASGTPHLARLWYKNRYGRLLPGYWALMAIWWFCIELWQAPDDRLVLEFPQFVLSFAGYAPWIGTSWFVTVVLTYVLAFPVLRAAVIGIGAPLALASAAFCSWASNRWMLEIVDFGNKHVSQNVPAPGFHYQWIFPPRHLWLVVAGIFLARFCGGRISRRLTLIAAVLFGLGLYGTILELERGPELIGFLRALALTQLLDVPLTMLLLGLLHWARVPTLVRDFLGWCGRWTWGIYLGHLLIFELMRIGRFEPAELSDALRLGYAALLFVGGVVLALGADSLYRQLKRRMPWHKASGASQTGSIS
jgi:peptidoglycan/LPS O-acetylase OafA/YrhL